MANQFSDKRGATHATWADAQRANAQYEQSDAQKLLAEMAVKQAASNRANQEKQDKQNNEQSRAAQRQEYQQENQAREDRQREQQRDQQRFELEQQQADDQRRRQQQLFELERQQADEQRQHQDEIAALARDRVSAEQDKAIAEQQRALNEKDFIDFQKKIIFLQHSDNLTRLERLFDDHSTLVSEAVAEWLEKNAMASDEFAQHRSALTSFESEHSEALRENSNLETDLSDARLKLNKLFARQKSLQKIDQLQLNARASVDEIYKRYNGAADMADRVFAAMDEAAGAMVAALNLFIDAAISSRDFGFRTIVQNALDACQKTLPSTLRVNWAEISECVFFDAVSSILQNASNIAKINVANRVASLLVEIKGLHLQHPIQKLWHEDRDRRLKHEQEEEKIEKQRQQHEEHEKQRQQREEKQRIERVEREKQREESSRIFTRNILILISVALLCALALSCLVFFAQLAAQVQADAAKKAAQAQVDAAKTAEEDAIKKTPSGFQFVKGEPGCQSFYISKYETTWEKWITVRTWAATHGYYIENIGDVQSGNYPVGSYPVCSVSCYDAVTWCNAASEMDGLTPVYMKGETILRTSDKLPEGVMEATRWENQHFGYFPRVNANANGYRLPTTAEWDWAARGGTKTKSYKYSGSNILSNVAWFNENSGEKSHPAGQLAANELGIYDMNGNVSEWCGSLAERSVADRVIRGGAYFDNENAMLVESNAYPWTAEGHIGFRLVRSLAK
ncbi:MAG: SUMF1/EgtB/PvdO family nonheme iron enzyme [bacterium]